MTEIGGSLSVRIGSTRAERTAAREDEHQRSNRDLRVRRFEKGGREAKQEIALTVRDESVFFWIPTIEQLKREGRLSQALNLAWECMEVMEREWPTQFSQSYPPHGWAMKVAIIARKMRRFDLEVEVLERWLAFLSPAQLADAGFYGDVKRRLAKARDLASGA